MNDRDWIENDYFEWMYNLVSVDRHPSTTYRKLLTHLHEREFTYILEMDENRANDGINLRYRFGWEQGDLMLGDYIYGPCSILEMMIALALKCEEIMDNPDVGDRTAQWFWGMVNNLGLGASYDTKFNKQFVDGIIDRFLNREYERNGRGGLFTVRNRKCDMRDIEIWYQLNWYLDNIV